MKKLTLNLFALVILLCNFSCTKEQDIDPENVRSDAYRRTSSCYLDQRDYVLSAPEPVGIVLADYLNCLNDDGSECIYTLPQVASYGSIDIYPDVSHKNNIWTSQNWTDAIILAQQVAQTGLNTVAWPAGATAIRIARYEIIDNWVSFPNPNPYNPWIYELNVKVYYKFCGVPGPGDSFGTGTENTGKN